MFYAIQNQIGSMNAGFRRLLNTTNRATAALLAAAAFAMALPSAALAEGTADTVYVYNGGTDNEGRKNDKFNTGCQGWIFARTGLLDANGKPPTVDGDDLKHGDTVVGHVIRNDAGEIVGYENADGSKKAFNVDKTTTARAWTEVTDDGELIIAKHGVTGGGGITLDNGIPYDGFTDQTEPGPGTGRGLRGGAYPLPPRPSAGIHLYVNSCYSDQTPAPDPDPDTEKPVTESGGEVPGVGSTSGNEDVVYKGTNWRVTGTNQQVADAVAAMAACAKAAGYKKADGSGDISEWIASLPFPSQYQTVHDCMAASGANLALSYFKDPECLPDGSGGGCVYEPLVAIPMTTQPQFMSYQVSPEHFRIEAMLPPAVLPPGSVVQLHPATIEPEMLLPGTEPATYGVQLTDYALDGQPFFQQQPMIRVGISPADAEQLVGVFDVTQPGQPLPLPFQIVPGQPLAVQFQPFRPGIYATLRNATQPPTCPTDLTGDGVIDLSDLALMLSQFGMTGAGLVADIDGNGAVDIADLAMLLGDFGASCD